MQAVGPFTLGETLGRGGMAQVWRARHVHTGVSVALKILDPRVATRRTTNAFLLEAQKKGRAAGTARPAAAWQALSDRLRQMKTVPAFGRSYRAASEVPVVCSRKDGRSDRVVLVAVEDAADEPARSTAGMAMLISLAKAWDTRRPPPQTILFCAWEGDDGFAAFTAAPPVSLDSIDAGWVLGGPSQPLAAGTQLERHALKVGKSVDALNFERLQESTRAVEGTVRKAVSASP